MLRVTARDLSIVCTVILVLGLVACARADSGPPPGPPELPEPPEPPEPQGKKAGPRDLFDRFQRGLGYLEEDKKPVEALQVFEGLMKDLPGESAVHANAAVAVLRDMKQAANRDAQVKKARSYAEKALQLDPENGYAHAVLGELAYFDRDQEAAVAAFEKAVRASPNVAIFRYRLVKAWELAPRGDEKAMLEAAEARLEHLKALATLLPDNVIVRLELLQAAADLDLADTVARHLTALEPLGPMLDERKTLPILERARQVPDKLRAAKEALEQGRASGASEDEIRVLERGLRGARSAIRQLGNVMKGEPSYAMALNQLTEGLDGVRQPTLSEAFLAKVPWASPPEAIPVKLVSAGPIAPAGRAFLLDADGDQDLDAYVPAEGGGVFLNDGGVFEKRLAVGGLPLEGVTAAAGIDLDNEKDSRLELVIATKTGMRVFRANAEGLLVEKTPEGLAGAGKGAILIAPVDFDHDADLDLLLGYEGAPSQLLRNNGDGTWPDKAAGAGLAGSPAGTRQAVAVDIDDDGDIDLVLRDGEGGLHLARSLRQGTFRTEPVVDLPSPARSFAVLDVDNDGLLDIAYAGGGAHVLRNAGEGRFEVHGVVGLPEGRTADVVVALDYDNDGFRDLALGGPGGALLYRNAGGKLEASPVAAPVEFAVLRMDALDADVDGDIDLVLHGEGASTLFRNEGGNANHWLSIRFRGLPENPLSGRTNRFGLATRCEVLAGDLYQLHFVDGIRTHFGLGKRRKADAVRIVWTNGVPQNHFDVEADLDLEEEAVLKGSCPFLYTWNGERFEFVTDILGGAPLGLLVDEKSYAWIDREDFIRIRGDQLRPKDGQYVVQVTEELWECIYYDEGELYVVDHPADVEVYTNEKFAPPPFPENRLHAAADLRPVRAALDTGGRDVTGQLRRADGVHVADFERVGYQGKVTPHSLTLDLGDLGEAERIRLFLTGWIYWSDTSINVAMGQNASLGTQMPRLSVPDGEGGWKVAIPFFGFPAGKTKTVVHDLTGLFPGDDFRVRIDTDLEIYWDRALVSTQPDDSETRVHVLKPARADVHHRGFSRMYRDGPHSPHLYDYHQVTRESRWRDMEGLYTRYGDATPLVQRSDDRLVIFGAGDELTLEFDVADAPPVPEGWRRTFFLRSVGYDKDGDLNTTFGQTVEPLPFLEMSGYPYGGDEAYPAGPDLEEYRRTYNTREVRQDAFRTQLRSREPLRTRSRGPGR